MITFNEIHPKQWRRRNSLNWARSNQTGLNGFCRHQKLLWKRKIHPGLWNRRRDPIIKRLPCADDITSVNDHYNDSSRCTQLIYNTPTVRHHCDKDCSKHAQGKTVRRRLKKNNLPLRGTLRKKGIKMLSCTIQFRQVENFGMRCCWCTCWQTALQVVWSLPPCLSGHIVDSDPSCWGLRSPCLRLG